MTPEQSSSYQAWADKFLNDVFTEDRDGLRSRLVSMLSQAHSNGVKDGRTSEIHALGAFLSMRCGGGNVVIPEIGSPINDIPMRKIESKVASRKIPTKDIDAVYLKVVSDDDHNVIDWIIKVCPGGGFRLNLPSKDGADGVLNFPAHIPADQRRLISDGGGLRVPGEDDVFDPPWGYEDEGMNWKPEM